jgi:hypothetical protein
MSSSDPVFPEPITIQRDTTHICMAGILQNVSSRLHVCRDRYYLAIHHDGVLSPTIFFALLSLKEYTKVILLDELGYNTHHFPWCRGDVVVNPSVETTIEKDQVDFQSILERDRGVSLFCPWNNDIWDHLREVLPFLKKAYPNVYITLGDEA